MALVNLDDVDVDVDDNDCDVNVDEADSEEFLFQCGQQ